MQLKDWVQIKRLKIEKEEKYYTYRMMTIYNSLKSNRIVGESQNK